MVAVAIIGAAVVGAGASVAASGSASKTARDTANQNNALQTNIYGQNKAALQPYMDAGGPATAAIGSLLGFNGPEGAAGQKAALDNWRNSTGYQDQLAQGQKAALSGYSRAGMLDSGAALKGLDRYGTQQANQSFGQYYGMLQGQQQVGLTGASALAGVGQGYANSVTANNNNAANTVENAALSNAGQINGAIGSALSAYTFGQGMGSSYGGSGGSRNPYGVQSPTGAIY